MFTLQYWNQGTAEWRGAGFRTDDYAAAQRAMCDNQRMTDYTVRFRILTPPPSPLELAVDQHVNDMRNGFF